MTDVFIGYFEAETGLHLPDDLLAIIAGYYEDNRHRWSRRQFCEAYMANDRGVADDIRMRANIAHNVERIRAAETIAELQRQLAEARATASGAA